MTKVHTKRVDTSSDMDGTYTPSESTASSPMSVIKLEPSASTEPRPEVKQDPEAIGEEARATAANSLKAPSVRRTQQQEDAKNKTLLCHAIIFFIVLAVSMFIFLESLRQEFGDNNMQAVLTMVAVVMLCFWFPSKLVRIYVEKRYEGADAGQRMD
ncbi:hypothetical protein LTS10_005185 [Elasticomyces elasticus]|nr:hypothetical protein LTS10_005185 [Elasticomyces elasticus]